MDDAPMASRFAVVLTDPHAAFLAALIVGGVVQLLRRSKGVRETARLMVDTTANAFSAHWIQHTVTQFIEEILERSRRVSRIVIAATWAGLLLILWAVLDLTLAEGPPRLDLLAVMKVGSGLVCIGEGWRMAMERRRLSKLVERLILDAQIVAAIEEIAIPRLRTYLFARLALLKMNAGWIAKKQIDFLYFLRPSTFGSLVPEPARRSDRSEATKIEAEPASSTVAAPATVIPINRAERKKAA